MQRLAFNWIRQERQRTGCNIFVPEVYRVMTRDWKTVIVMELVRGFPLDQFGQRFDPQSWEKHRVKCCDMVVEGTEALRRMPVPDDATPGPYTSANRRVRHQLLRTRRPRLSFRPSMIWKTT